MIDSRDFSFEKGGASFNFDLYSPVLPMMQRYYVVNSG
jgi:hypothetical protein